MWSAKECGGMINRRSFRACGVARTSTMAWRKRGSSPPLRQLGFTLIELCIVVVIVAILAAVAIPSYQSYVKESRRQEAQQGLLTLSLLMERSFARTGSYPIATLPSADLPTAYYSFSLDASSSVSTFKMQAAPIGSQSGDSCGTMTLNQAGQKTPANCWR
jgi:type IV pilus assembly protein PilE